MTLVVDWAVKPQYKPKNEESDQTGQMFRPIVFLVERTSHIVDFVIFQPISFRRLLLYKKLAMALLEMAPSSFTGKAPTANVICQRTKIL